MDQYLRDQHFESHQAASCDLLIQLTPFQINYAIVDQRDRSIQVLSRFNYPTSHNAEDIIERLDVMAQTRPELNLPFAKTKISLQNQTYTFIPTTLFDPSLVGDYAKFMQNPSHQTQPLIVHELPAMDIQNVSIIHESLQKGLEARFNNLLVVNQASPFLIGLNKQITNQQDCILAIHVQAEAVEFAFFEKGALQFYNLFECMNPDELNYFLLQVIKELDLSSAPCNALIAGDIKQGDPNYIRIEKYFKEIRTIYTWQALSPPNFNELVSNHDFFSLISLNLCE